MSQRFLAAIGGSAGVLEPLRAFFDHTPSDQLSYVILRHLAPTHQSQLKQILRKHSRLEIIEVDRDMPLEKNKIYLMPPDKYLVISNETFHLVERNAQGPNRAVDIFFQSMAWDHGAKSIAVVLSGAGTDGTAGAKYVKEAGGMVIAQHPSSCEYPSMPMHVIESGSADELAFPQDMPAIIRKHIKEHD